MAGEAPAAGRAGLHSSGSVLAESAGSVVATVQKGGISGPDFANGEEIERAAQIATLQLNCRAKPWVWGRAQKHRRHRRRSFVVVDQWLLLRYRRRYEYANC